MRALEQVDGHDGGGGAAGSIALVLVCTARAATGVALVPGASGSAAGGIALAPGASGGAAGMVDGHGGRGSEDSIHDTAGTVEHLRALEQVNG